VINPDQVHISIMKKSPNMIPFNFSFGNKDNLEMLDELGNLVLRTAQTVPGGILIFFPSYWLMEKVYERWS
jgi:Rad3-related DNA helicase